MCKFESKNSPGYLAVSQTIKDWVQEAPRVIQARRDMEIRQRRQALEAQAAELLHFYVSNQLFDVGAVAAHSRPMFECSQDIHFQTNVLMFAATNPPRIDECSKYTWYVTSANGSAAVSSARFGGGSSTENKVRV
jgi:hypothetical protein